MTEPQNRFLSVGSWIVDLSSGDLSRDGAQIRLETRTMRLLAFLAARPGEVVSIDSMLTEVWPDVIVTPDSVYQAITSLRRALGDNPKRPSYIATVPRLGYRLIATVRPTDGEPPAATPATPVETIAPIALPARGAGRAVIPAIAALCALLLAGWLLTPSIGRLLSGKDKERETAPRIAGATLAVLPFADMTNAMDEEPFADGMSEELIDKLSKIPGLRVAARSSTFAFKDKQMTATDIAKSLGVAYILDGSVRKSGTTLRVTAQLISATQGYLLWSQTYDRPSDDILAIQDSIAREVKSALENALPK